MKSIAHCLFASLLALGASAASAQDAQLLAEARGVAATVPPRLLAVLNEEIARSGHDGAIDVCRVRAPQMAKEASERSGWQIRRVSLRNRNPKAVPDAWERAALEDFDRRAAAGEDAAALEKGEVVTESGVRSYRYIRALPTQPLCLACHGSADNVSPAVKAKIDALYPADRATGYAPGQIRGALTVRRAL